MDAAVEAAFRKVRRDMQVLESYFAEADAALAKAETHIATHAPHAKLLELVAKARTWTRELLRSIHEQATAILGGPDTDT